MVVVGVVVVGGEGGGVVGARAKGGGKACVCVGVRACIGVPQECAWR